MIPRGIRLNNPGNIERNATIWQGMSTLQDDPRFIRFDKPEWGLRAIMKILMNYQDKHDLYTVKRMISRWAPPSENNTESYVNHVAKHCGVLPNEPFNVHDAAILKKLAQAITVHENGKAPVQIDYVYWYDDDIYDKAVKLATS